MTHPDLPITEAGIRGVFQYDHELGKVSRQLAQQVLRNTHVLTAQEAEAIAVHVSKLNQTNYCINSHQSALDHLGNFEQSRLPKLFEVAEQVVKLQTINFRETGLDAEAVFECAAVAAAFCFFNRLVTAINPTEPEDYEAIGKELAIDGYWGLLNH